MASSNAVRFLSNASGSDDTSLALKMYWGSVVEAYRTSSYLWEPPAPIIKKKTVTSGKSWQYLMLADTPDPEDHTEGDELLGQNFAVEEGTITVDQILVAHQDVPISHLAFSHFDVLGPLGVKNGKRLARKYDQRACQTAVLAYRTAAVTKNGLTVHNGGNLVQRSGSATITTAYPATPQGAQRIMDDCAELAYAMDVDECPEDRWILLHKHFRRVLTRENGFHYDTPANTVVPRGSGLFGSDYNTVGNDLNRRQIMMIEGFKILGFANYQSAGGPIPDTNIATGLSQYQVNCAGAATGTGKPVGIAFVAAGDQGQAGIGSVSFQGVRAHMETDERRNTVFMKAQMLAGMSKMHVWNTGGIEIYA